MFESLFIPWQQIYHLAFLFTFRTTPEVSSKCYFLKHVRSQRSYGFLITKELIFGFQILYLKDHFSASLKKDNRGVQFEWDSPVIEFVESLEYPGQEEC